MEYYLFSDRLEHSSKHSVHLVPRGTQEKPSDLKELLQALICLLICLRGLHEIRPKPLMHRDIRWPNVIKYYDRYKQFILIDFEIATFSPSQKRLQEVSGLDHAPEMLVTIHDTSVDIWGIGNLVGTCNINGIPSELSQFGSNLCHRIPRKRPNASETLEQWFDDDDDDGWLEKIERDG
ncbi:hypothetical protein RclHR1_13630004 [Rhizophagus clarus]|uniref:Protein kinase domain-containing protein n=1 Tax=Rhizophagus clarus TaxID=94130 RepID=A0A2Z6QQE9_9GLOM|nr:hypothetical protein RclHR1_13630004 [Rhizophagus clarus]